MSIHVSVIVHPEAKHLCGHFNTLWNSIGTSHLYGSDLAVPWDGAKLTF